MKRLIKEILYAAHECGVCPDWGDKVVEGVLDILKRDGIVNQNDKVSRWVDGLPFAAHGNFYSENDIKQITRSNNKIE